jgi:hypothetical protein
MLLLVPCGTGVERLVREVVFNLDVDDGRKLAVQHFGLLGNDVQHIHFVVLCQQVGVGRADLAGAGNGEFHFLPFRCLLVDLLGS